MKELSDTIKYYIKNNGFVPSSLKKNIFTDLAKDKIDFNATPSTAVQQCAINYLLMILTLQI